MLIQILPMTIIVHVICENRDQVIRRDDTSSIIIMQPAILYSLVFQVTEADFFPPSLCLSMHAQTIDKLLAT